MNSWETGLWWGDVAQDAEPGGTDCLGITTANAWLTPKLSPSFCQAGTHVADLQRPAVIITEGPESMSRQPWRPRCMCCSIRYGERTGILFQVAMYSGMTHWYSQYVVSLVSLACLMFPRVHPPTPCRSTTIDLLVLASGADQSFAFQAARSADSSGFSRPSQNKGHSWNHFSRLQVEYTERLWPKSTYLPMVSPWEFS